MSTWPSTSTRCRSRGDGMPPQHGLYRNPDCHYHDRIKFQHILQVTLDAKPQVTPLQDGYSRRSEPWDCISIAKASKVRILHLPPRAERALDLRKRRSGPFRVVRL